MEKDKTPVYIGKQSDVLATTALAICLPIGKSLHTDEVITTWYPISIVSKKRCGNDWQLYAPKWTKYNRKCVIGKTEIHSGINENGFVPYLYQETYMNESIGQSSTQLLTKQDLYDIIEKHYPETEGNIAILTTVYTPYNKKDNCTANQSITFNKLFD